jgi:hypothetical protein
MADIRGTISLMRPKPGVADDSCLLEPACGSGHFLVQVQVQVQVLCLDLAAGMRSRCALMMASPSALQIANGDHAAWYRDLFGPSVTAGTVQAAGLAGDRKGPVYIRRSKHTPPNVDAVRDLMPAARRL